MKLHSFTMNHEHLEVLPDIQSGKSENQFKCHWFQLKTDKSTQSLIHKDSRITEKRPKHNYMSQESEISCYGRHVALNLVINVFYFQCFVSKCYHFLATWLTKNNYFYSIVKVPNILFDYTRLFLTDKSHSVQTTITIHFDHNAMYQD